VKKLIKRHFYISVLLLMLLKHKSDAQLIWRPFFELKSSLELNSRLGAKKGLFKHSGNLSNLNLQSSIGTKGAFPHAKILTGKDLDFFFTPILHANLLIGKGLGASMLDRMLFLRPSLIFSFNLSGEWNGTSKYHWNREIRYYSSTISGTFRNDKSNVVNLSTNMALVDFTKSRKYHRQNRLRQTSGSLFVGHRRLNYFYHNEGPPFNFIGLGDGYDRLYTGGGHLGVLLGRPDPQNLRILDKEIFVSYERFTGYEHNAYESAVALSLDHVNYENLEVATQNRGFFKLGISNFNKIGGGLIINENDRLDAQNIIHIIRSEALHRTANRSSFSLFVTQTEFKTL